MIAACSDSLHFARRQGVDGLNFYQRRPTDIMIQLTKMPNESEEQFIWRLGRAKDCGELDLEWEEIADIINKECREDESEYRNESAYRKPYQQAKRFYEAGVFKDLTAEAYIKIMQEQTRSLKMEKQKVRDEKLELNRWMRQQARDELICEKICDEVKALPPVEFPALIPCEPRNTEAVLCFADTHYGTEFEIKGLFGNVLNRYSPEIFGERMFNLLCQAIRIIEEKGLTRLHVFSLGDEIDGILRVSQLMKLRHGVVESTIQYAEYISNWLNELTKHVHVDFYSVCGNHTELRMLGQPKGTFTEDNMTMVINEFIKTRLADNANFTFHHNETGLIYNNICGYNVLGIHGEVKNLGMALTTFTNTYGVMIDILVGAHKHHLSMETVGRDKEVISVPSVIGIDDYAMSLGKTSNPGALMFFVEEGKGIVEQRNLKLNDGNTPVGK